MASGQSRRLLSPSYRETPNRSEAELDKFFAETGILVDWNLEEGIWRGAGKAYRGYVQRRRSSSSAIPRRILADFLIVWMRLSSRLFPANAR